ncbi:hypothetical protein [Anaerotignum sp.]|uniref:hypothetical protein n=1 Tax=Anaerotignum sp. TaxID=2039241 RepID=UPI0028A95C8B|nr:hypothetical protein [Anaerotignum sp.]
MTATTNSLGNDHSSKWMYNGNGRALTGSKLSVVSDTPLATMAKSEVFRVSAYKNMQQDYFQYTLCG